MEQKSLWSNHFYRFDNILQALVFFIIQPPAHGVAKNGAAHCITQSCHLKKNRGWNKLNLLETPFDVLFLRPFSPFQLNFGFFFKHSDAFSWEDNILQVPKTKSADGRGGQAFRASLTSRVPWLPGSPRSTGDLGGLATP